MKTSTKFKCVQVFKLDDPIEEYNSIKKYWCSIKTGSYLDIKRNGSSFNVIVTTQQNNPKSWDFYGFKVDYYDDFFMYLWDVKTKKTIRFSIYEKINGILNLEVDVSYLPLEDKTLARYIQILEFTEIPKKKRQRS